MIRVTTCCLTIDECNALIARWNGLCAYCMRPVKGRYCMEHVEPLSRGGEDVPENIVPACASCNSAKHDLFLLEWAFYREGLLRQDHETRLPYAVDEDRPRLRPRNAERRFFDAPLRRIESISGEVENLECGHRVVTRRTDFFDRPVVRRRCYECYGWWPAHLRPDTSLSSSGVTQP